MTAFTQTKIYARCQARFEALYPGFEDAGSRYARAVAEAVGPESVVLDVGAGRMSFAAASLSQAAFAAGVDLVLDDLEANDQVKAAVATAEALPFAAGCFDVVISQWVVEHFEQPRIAFAEMARVLRPGGRLILFSTNRTHPVSLAGRLLPAGARNGLIRRLLRRPAHETHPVYYRANTEADLRALATASGLELVLLDWIGNPFYAAFSALAFTLALAYERVTDRPKLRRFKLYWVAVLTKA